MILYKLPMTDVLFAQKISKHWKTVIDDSIKLQRALFFKPIITEDVSESKWTKCSTEGNSTEVKAFANPLIIELIQFLEIISFDKDDRIEHEMNIHGLHPSHFEPTASFRRMLSTQPPTNDCVTIEILAFNRDKGASEWINDIACSAKTAGGILDELDSATTTFEDSWSGIEIQRISPKTGETLKLSHMLNDNVELDEFIEEIRAKD